MPKNSSAARDWKDPRIVVRVILGVLLAANLVAAGLVMFPPGGSADDLEREMASLQTQVAQNRKVVEQTRQHAAAVEMGKAEGDKFLDQYFLDRRTYNLNLQTALNDAATASKVTARNTSFAPSPIDGSDTLSMITVTTEIEGTYHDVMNFVHEIDKSPRLLIIESLNASPQQGSNILSVQMKLNAFMREDQAQ